MPPLPSAQPSLPSASALPRPWLAALLVILVAAALALQVHPMADPDVFVHMRDGAHWLKTGFRFFPEPFAYTVPGQGMDKIEVLFSVLAHGVYRLGGLTALILGKALVMTLFWCLLTWLMYRRSGDLGPAIFLSALLQITPTLLGFFRERSYLFTYVFLAAVMLALEEFRKPGGRRRWLWLLPAAAPVWVNLHPGFAVVFVVLGAHLADEAWAYIRSREPEVLARLKLLAIIAAATFTAGAVNPLGFGIYTYTQEHISTPLFLNFISEWNPPTFAKHPDFFLWLGAAWLVLLANWRRWQVHQIAVLAAFSVLAVTSYRHIALFFLAAAPVLADGWSAWLAPILRARQKWLPVVAAGILLVTIPAAAGPKYILRLGLYPDYYPVAGLAWLQSHPVQGRLLTPIHWAGYASWASPAEASLFMDGRLMLFGERVFEEYIKIFSGEPGECPALLARYGIETILVPADNNLRLFIRLDESRGWSLVYWDQVCQIYVRQAGVNASLAQQHAYAHVAPWKPMPYLLDFDQPAATAGELERAQREAPGSYLPPFLLGQLLMQGADLDQAAAAFALALQRDPAQYTAHYNLGLIAYRAGNLPEAQRHLRRSLAAQPTDSDRAQIIKLLIAVEEKLPGK